MKQVDPTKHLEKDPCPACGAEVEWKTDNSGDEVVIIDYCPECGYIE